MMESHSKPEVYDLLVLVDATYSMSSYLNSLQHSLPQIIEISTLTDCFSRIGLLAYRDYCDQQLLEWSGWLSPSTSLSRDSQDQQIDLIKMAKKLEPIGGGDGPEATKTGLAMAYELMRTDACTIILLYTDAPPHTPFNGDTSDSCSNLGPERKALKMETSYGGFGPHFVDWVSASKWLSGRSGEKKAQVFSILEKDMPFAYAGYYNYLSAMTGGAAFYLTDSKPASISKVTVEVLLAWMGAEKAGTSANIEFPAYLTRYISINGMKKLLNERDPDAQPFFLATHSRSAASGENITKIRCTAEVLKKHLPGLKETPVLDFAKRYSVDERYKKTAIEHLQKIIAEDVATISLNPVFGSLWRAVCNDRENPARDEAITAFGHQVDRIQNGDEKARMKAWLEESYDYTTEVTEAIESVPASQRFPCVCLDPTLVFTHETDEDEEESKPITSFRRDELLEIGRSCDYRILRRLGRVLTRLTYINSAEEMPAHIAAASETETPRIPMALASTEFKRKFWKILLHIVVPGTMLGARPAALLAALSIRLGVKPLQEAADQEMLLWRDRWNNIEVPETWNTSCLSLLLDADSAYQKRQAEKPEAVTDTTKQAETLLKYSDRALFDCLVTYKLLEMNLETELTARIGWTPGKTPVPMGPTAICRSCDFPRSVTIMGLNGKCGLCLGVETVEADTKTSAAERKAAKDAIAARVTKEDKETTPLVWVECNIRTCRAQYVVYRPEALNVKPKCYYCRTNSKTPAPFVECTDCLNRVIYPMSYRPTDMKDFKCYACANGRKTVVTVETTANKLTDENTTAWLLKNENKKIAEPFSKRSLFHTIAKAGAADFTTKVEVFPEYQNLKLALNGKLVRNVPELVEELKSWISRRKTESGTCSLCFSSFKKSDVLRACGRTGCSQRICKGCLKGWYGLNGCGRIINTAALSCPFCRRDPTAKTLAKYGMGIHAVGDLAIAVRDKGQWISAWCRQCGYAKRYIERVCAAGAPVELQDWVCDDCKDHKGDKIKKCPGCGTMTEKTSGCDHITCTVDGCGTHWCFFCGGKFDENAIYTHMSTEHGGYYNGGEDEEPDEEEDED
ncbi:uncharacterized protein K444DRAFT_564766 [Hyaloscypha bicolor E]|uniref:RBR-type E3 ubiquitin transferase n=1 Tax=Hyaloscypha bicolor E TaxID=1095630 RepID=A0A2J6T4E5_9HELO|nr:uncharacterized protein K444DRAFT_564766 [Hyaloscypha bicolor E]PMD57892.1 hypothetical protein K444DRAFT_564766 [Hyaloscypha bicolor E]